MFLRNSATLATIAAVKGRPRLLIIGAAISAAALGGCQPTAPFVASADPADPNVAVPRATYRSAIAPYSSLRPSTPAPWLERNDAVSPKRSGEGSER